MIGRYVVDFACLKARLVIEVDGGQHADSQLSGTPDIGGRGGMHGNHPERRPPP
jgi:hypothetical protein